MIFWYTASLGNFKQEGYKFAHLTYILWPHYLEKCEKSYFNNVIHSYVLPNIAVQFISPDMLPANSLDLNPVNHRIWA